MLSSVKDHFDVLIIGAGHAGAQAAIALRQGGFPGTIGMVGDETEPPYERPPLSKEYLSGEKEFDRLLIRPPAFWAENGIDLLLGEAAARLDADGHAVTLLSGRRLGYGKLVWAAGAAVRRLTCDGHDLDGVHAIRTRGDVDRLLSELPAVQRVVIVGAGYIGLEAAAGLVKFGKQVTVVEMQSRVLARVAGEALSRFFEAEHRAHGIDIRLEAVVAGLEAEDGRVSGVRLLDGSRLDADLVIVGIGVIPNVAPLIDAGAAASQGVDVDALCRTTLPDVFAIGDCVAQESLFADGRRLRIESVQNAKDQAVTVAKAINGVEIPYAAVPWFWSNQYDLRLQTVGLSIGHDEVVLRGDTAERAFSLIYLRLGRVVALDCVNRAGDYMQGRALVAAHVAAAASDLRDLSIPLKSLLTPTAG